MSGARTGRRKTRCAIYTRKSSEEGLEQDFNSLDAQREACAAYVLSQKHEGWTTLSERYDDWTSLSAVARAITGSRRNGPAFFGLRERDAA